jgi:hydrogenase nickel incorporation protein HypA/HybF
MHEESLVRSLLRQVELIAAENDATEITEIEVEIGPLSGVEPLLVESAFERVAASTACGTAKLSIHQVGLEAICESCGQGFGMQELRFCCPFCEAGKINIVRGEEFRLMNVTLET